MPEKPEVAQSCDALRHLLTNKDVLIEMAHWPAQVPTNLKVLQIIDWGKYILWYMQYQDYQFSLIQHMKLTGSYRLVSPEINGLKPAGRIMIMQNQYTIYYYDTRKLSVWHFYDSPQAGYDHLNKTLGIDWLIVARLWQTYEDNKLQTTEINLNNLNSCYQHFYQQFHKSTRNICTWLMDQAYFAGIGNYLKAEILFIECLHPDLNCNQLQDWQVFNLFCTICRTILASYYAGGVSVSDYQNVDGHDGIFLRFVYKAPNNLDRIFNQPVITSQHTGRSTYWCPQVQSIPINPQIYSHLQQINEQRYQQARNHSCMKGFV